MQQLERQAPELGRVEGKQSTLLARLERLCGVLGGPNPGDAPHGGGGNACQARGRGRGTIQARGSVDPRSAVLLHVCSKLRQEAAHDPPPL
ncbi:hypothetical protein [Nannocystis bainbridge]|uniref:Uncharacterized protein n=1 Tax=Nannocystis bainbridge TaxID=2995303 RepID=A0ABT5DRR8_9BACT|nr:hypothetical protein [Nannocystis bainbridge]MDC0716241.1 hypothetical protein [Nannocystis bainbridge]